jgi:hypothetical protein
MIRQKGNQNPRYFRGLLEALRDGRIVASSRPKGTEGPPNHRNRRIDPPLRPFHIGATSHPRAYIGHGCVRWSRTRRDAQSMSYVGHNPSPSPAGRLHMERSAELAGFSEGVSQEPRAAGSHFDSGLFSIRFRDLLDPSGPN